MALHQLRPNKIARDVQEITKGAMDRGAVCDLVENNPAIAGLTATVAQAHAVTASGGPAGSPIAPARYLDRAFANFEKVLTRKECVSRTGKSCSAFANVYDQTIVDAFRFREANDAIVPISSQTGGLSTALTNYPDRTSQLGGLSGTPTTNRV